MIIDVTTKRQDVSTLLEQGGGYECARQSWQFLVG